MKLALNGALTIGTLDGANVEIRERVGPENIFIFGLTADQVAARKQRGYDAREAIDQSPSLREVLDAVGSGVFSHDQPDRFRDLIDAMYGNDQFLVTADFDSYAACQREVAELWHDRHAWWKASVLNTARVAWFSSDRTITEYASDIWNVATTVGGK
jgi:starch phosphorylase